MLNGSERITYFSCDSVSGSDEIKKVCWHGIRTAVLRSDVRLGHMFKRLKRIEPT